MLKHLVLLIFGINIIFGASFAQTKHAKVELISEYTQVKEGETFWIGVKFNLIPHWHVYWKNPGDSGQATSVKLSLPDGYTQQEMKWPIPKRIPYGPAINYGYENQVVFLIPITAKNSSSEAVLKAKLNWLVCEKVCIPEEATLDFKLPKIGNENIANVQNQNIIYDSVSKLPISLTREPKIISENGKIKLLIKEEWAKESIKDIWFASNEWGIVSSSAKQSFTFTDEGIELTTTSGDIFSAEKKVSGILILEEKVGNDVIHRGFFAGIDKNEEFSFSSALLIALASAFIGGLILNLMPCVLPILTIKILGFVKESNSSKKILASHGISFTLGVVLSFLVLAGVLIALRTGGEALGWGFQLQSPLFVTLLALLMLLIGFNLSGVFEVTQNIQGFGQTKKEGKTSFSSFASGVLAVNVASPCTAPFMGAALGYAITRPVLETLLVFFALGIGFALPVLLFSLFPTWLKILPKPGNWMLTMRQIFAFPMYATAAWLVWVTSQQTAATGLAVVFTSIILVAFASWAYGRVQLKQLRPKIGNSLALVSFLIALSILSFVKEDIKSVSDDSYESWSKNKVSKLVQEEKAVFVNFTASWCITCKINEQVAIKTEAVKDAFEQYNIQYLKGDWTNQNSAITKELEKHGRSGVPLYLLFIPGQKKVKVLPQVLTEGIILNEIKKI